jgi:8-oxo-dGTP pyrophosphatase MutT (NUDIX family)
LRLCSDERGPDLAPVSGWVTSASTIPIVREKRSNIRVKLRGDEPVGFLEAMTNLTRATARGRLQYAALPYRQNKASRTEFLLVTSRETGRWIIPKGWPIKRRSPQVSAAREAREEAGVVGKISRRPIGWFSYEKRLKRGIIIVCKVQVFALKVKRQQESWPEKGQREVQWMSRTKAAKVVADSKLGSIIRMLKKRP